MISVDVAVPDSDTICISCVFTHGSPATGCVVKINNNVDVMITLNSSVQVVNSTVKECFKTTANNESHWEAFATQGPSLLFSKPAFTGILVYSHPHEGIPLSLDDI